MECTFVRDNLSFKKILPTGQRYSSNINLAQRDLALAIIIMSEYKKYKPNMCCLYVCDVVRYVASCLLSALPQKRLSDVKCFASKWGEGSWQNFHVTYIYNYWKIPRSLLYKSQAQHQKDLGKWGKIFPTSLFWGKEVAAGCLHTLWNCSSDFSKWYFPPRYFSFKLSKYLLIWKCLF